MQPAAAAVPGAAVKLACAEGLSAYSTCAASSGKQKQQWDLSLFERPACNDRHITSIRGPCKISLAVPAR